MCRRLYVILPLTLVSTGGLSDTNGKTLLRRRPLIPCSCCGVDVGVAKEEKLDGRTAAGGIVAGGAMKPHDGATAESSTVANVATILVNAAGE